jgi:hypothetical protein
MRKLSKLRFLEKIPLPVNIDGKIGSLPKNVLTAESA